VGGLGREILKCKKKAELCAQQQGGGEPLRTWGKRGFTVVRLNKPPKKGRHENEWSPEMGSTNEGETAGETKGFAGPEKTERKGLPETKKPTEETGLGSHRGNGHGKGTRVIKKTGGTGRPGKKT